jgi:hypothetical protein
MQKRFQLGQSTQPQPRWLQLVALVCLFLICIASTAEVCHTHPELASATKDSRHSTPATDHCPLCVAMHSALPATANSAPEPVLQIQMVLFKAVEVQRLQRWSFDLLSRPPPVLRFIA